MTLSPSDILSSVVGLNSASRHRLMRDAAAGRPARLGYHSGGHGGTSRVGRLAMVRAVEREIAAVEAEAVERVGRMRAWLERECGKGRKG